jgi:UDP-N-acetylglucosamine 2-epimerase (non-hydrolysing)
MACALTAVKMHIPVAHIEAGLRSGDRSMPEEINRIITDSISDLLFITEKSGLENLEREGIPHEKVFFTGNVMIDSLVYLREKIAASTILQTTGLKEKDYFLVTFHRPSNVDNQHSLQELIRFLNEISAMKEVVFPIHPRTLRKIAEFGLGDTVSSNVRMIEPLGYLDFQSLISKAFMIVTDSGGIQEETTFLGVPCVTVRDNTERPVTVEVGTNILCGSDTGIVLQTIRAAVAGNIKKGTIPELWDGKAAERIAEIIVHKL